MQTIIDKFFKKNWQITLVVLLAFVLRISLITINPPSLNWDEVSHGYNAYSIIKTGRDEWGELLPAIFRAYGDYKLPVYIYLTSISIAAFGLNAFAVRLPSVIAGVVTVVFTYLVTLELFKKKKKQSSFNPGHLALLSALLVAIEPWSFFLSRGAFEANVALSFIVAGIYYFLKGTKSSRYLPAAAILLGLSVWTYNSARIIVPVFTTLLMFLYRFEIKEMYRKSSKYLKISVAVALLLFLPMLWQLINPVGQARYSWVSIIDEGAIAQINEARNTSNLNETVKVALYNKGTYFVKEFVSNWASHFSGEFLFTRGGSHYQFSVPGHGLIFSINAILLLGGIIFLLKKKDRRAFVILGWFYLGSIASSLTREAPHVLRSITILPAPMILTSYGAIKSFSWLRKRSKVILKLFVLFYMFILVLYFGRYLKEYFNNYRVEYSWSWQYGYGQMVDYLKNYYQDYDKIVVTKKYGEPHEFILFYWPWDPASYRNDPDLVRFNQSNWYWVDGFDKFYFVNDWQIVEEKTGSYEFYLESEGVVECLPQETSCLLVTSPGNAPDGWRLIKKIRFLDGSESFEIYTNNSQDGEMI